MYPDDFAATSDPQTAEEAADVFADGDADAVDADVAEISFSAVQRTSAQSISATGSAIGVAKAEGIDAIGSAIGMASVGGDLSTRFSSTPLVNVHGDASIRQSYASALVAGGTVEMTQAVAPLVAGREVHIDLGGGAAVVAGDVKVERGFIGVLLAGRAEVGDETRVLIGTRAALIMGGVLLGGFALLAIAGVLGVRKLAEWRPVDFDEFAEHLPWLR